jgi:hypothetical protein
MQKVHVVELDTDSLYLAIAGNKEEDNKQCFKYVIADEKFYNEHIYSWASSDFYGVGGPKFGEDEKKQKMAFDKKLLGLAIEKQCDNMVALAPKMYTCYNAGDKYISRKVKGISIRQNDLQVKDYRDTLLNKSVVMGTNTNLNLHKGIMSKISVSKCAISAAHTKMHIMRDFSTCAPIMRGVRYEGEGEE